ncbi:MAG: dihydroorotate dehydrogenase [Vampirovibrionales bacterium]|nr:dihydroorotate dehydrogenase [Vampirovibrionales bacterium]
MSQQTPDLRVTLAGLTFDTPILNASGCFYPDALNAILPLKGALGALVVKTVTPQPRAGNPGPRAVELPGVGMLNSIGLQNPGIGAFLDDEAEAWAAYGLPVFLSMSAPSVEAFAEMTALLESHPNSGLITALELNLSCPNVAHGGVDFGAAPETIRAVVSQTRAQTDKPVFAKLTPNVGSIVPLAEAAAQAGAAGVSAVNTALGCAIDLRRRAPILARATGGYSGPGLKPIALRCVWEIHRELPELAIIGVGGIASVEDALEFIMAGASLVQVGTACFRSPEIFASLTRDLRRYLQQEGLCGIAALTGCAHGEKIR